MLYSRSQRRQKGLFYLYVAAALCIATWFFVLSPLVADILEPTKKTAKRAGRWHSGRAVVEVEASPTQPPSKYPGAAIITLAGGDVSGRNLVALLQSLRDVNTTLPIVVLLARGGLGSAVCSDQDWKARNNRSNVRCGSADTIAEEIVSPQYLDTFRRLGAEIRVIPWLPRTRYTVEVAGGLDSFWGYSLNRLVIFNMTEFKKLIYMDTDTLVLKNIDHLALEPTFTSAFTHSCCNRNDPPRISGGLWILEPDVRVGTYFWELMRDGRPTLFANGTIDESVPRHTWDLSDLDLAMFAFRDYDWQVYGWMFPKVADTRHGIAPGTRLLPQFRDMSDTDYNNLIRNPKTGKPYPEGFMPELYDPTKGGGVAGRGVPGVVWHTLGVQYDQCVGNLCECGSGLTGRNIPDLFYSVHFSCLQYTHKPGDFKSEYAFMDNLYHRAMGCSRHYFVLWYAAFQRAGHRLADPKWTGPPVPGHNATHDEFVAAWRKANNVRGAFG